MEEVMQTTLADNIRKARQAKNLSQNELAEKINEYSVYVSAFEHGIEIPSLSQLVRMADVFDCSVDWLLGREKKQTEASKEEETGMSYDDLMDAIFDLQQIIQDIVIATNEAHSSIKDKVFSDGGANSVFEKLPKRALKEYYKRKRLKNLHESAQRIAERGIREEQKGEVK